MSDKVELLPCPFCGQQDAFAEQLDSDASVVICQGRIDEHSACLARGPVGVQESDAEDQPGKEAAIREWNRRAAIAQQPAPVPVPSDFALRSRVADLLHLLQFAKIETPSHGDAAQAEVAMSDLERMLAAPAAPVARLLPDLPDQMARDLARFNETCEDGEEYDIPKERMRSMAGFGLVRWCGGSRFEITDCGIAALEAMAAPTAADQPDTVAVLREQLEEWADAFDALEHDDYASECRALLGKEGEA